MNINTNNSAGINQYQQINKELNKIEKEEKPDLNKKEISKVERIKQEIENGTYKVDLSKTATAMSKELMGF
jgi:anti-sigma28 factor (negative regulator of flagellin synthesis)